MVTKFTVFGSCSSRDIFFSGINKNYKDFFEIGEDGTRLSLISIMQPPINYDENSLKIFPETKDNINFSNWIKKDLDKTFLKVLKENNFEYMVFDTYYDATFGIVDIGDGQFITNNIGLDKTDFFKNLEYKRLFRIEYDIDNYYKLWKENCKLFFNYMHENCPQLKVILNCSRPVYKFSSNEQSENLELKQMLHTSHIYFRDLFDRYILENFDVDVLIFDEKTLANKNHIWGIHPTHYETKYYQEKTNQLNKIIYRNKTLNYNDELNIKIRQLRRKLSLQNLTV